MKLNIFTFISLLLVFFNQAYDLDQLESHFVSRLIPQNFDARTQWPECIHPIRDEEACHAGWAFSAAEILSDRNCIQGKLLVNLSPQNLISCDLNSGENKKCIGSNLQATWDFINKKGVVTDSCWPYESGDKDVPSCRSSCENSEVWEPYYATNIVVRHKDDKKKPELMDKGPIQTCFQVYEDFLTYKSGVYTHQTGDALYYHCVKVVGWGTEDGVQYWIAANSWGTDWGEQGYFKIKSHDSEFGHQGWWSADPYYDNQYEL